MKRHVTDCEHARPSRSEDSGPTGSEDDSDLADLDGIVRGDDGRLRAKMARHANGACLFEESEGYLPTFIPF